MTTLVLGTAPPELEALRARRRQAGVDRLDEVWQGVHNMVPGELLLVDPAGRTVTWPVLQDGTYRPAERSGLIDLSASDLAERVEWPATAGGV